MSAITRKRITQTIWVLCCVMALLWLRTEDAPVIATLRGAGFDTLQRLHPRAMSEPAPVRVIDIDEASLKALGQWPWSRFQLAKLVQSLTDLGAATIAFDIVFPEHDRLSPRRIMDNAALADLAALRTELQKLPDSDQAFAAAMAGKPVVTAFATSVEGADAKTLPVKTGLAQVGAPALRAPPLLRQVTGNIPEIDAAAAGLGSINLDLAGEQGVARQIPLLWSDGERFLPALSLEVLRVAQGVDTIIVSSDNATENILESVRVGDADVPVTESGMFHLHFRENSKDLYIPAVDVIERKSADVLRPKIEGHIVFIGTSAVGLLDMRTTPLGETVPGVSIHAQAVEQMLTGRFLSRPDWVQMLEYLFIAASGALLAVAGAIYRPLATMLMTAALGLAYTVGTIFVFRTPGLLFDVTFPLAALLLTYLASTAFRLAITDRDGRNMRRMFGHYVAPAVLADIEQNPQNLKLGGEVRNVTVMFVDIANFTPLSEKLSPEDLVLTVNGLWDACSKAILAHNGTIDKFIGDAIMAFWNAPVPMKDHQAAAAKAALGIRHAVDAYNKGEAMASLLANRGIPPIAVRVGLASGPACVGNMGSSERFNYSVLGETVNTAARTESSCKHVGHDILIAGTLHPETRKLATLFAGHAQMKGKSKPEPIHVLLGDEAMQASDAFLKLKREHDHLVTKLAQAPSSRTLATIQQLFKELSLRNPDCATYLSSVAQRPEDFREGGINFDGKVKSHRV